METESYTNITQTTDGAQLSKDLEEISRPVNDQFACHLSKVVLRKYAEVLLYSGDNFTEETLKKMKIFSAMSQDIARLRRADLAQRRVQLEETRVQNSHQRTEEQVIEQFKQWAEIPEVRRCFILAPMEQMRRLRILYGLPPTKDDPILQKIVEAHPAFGKFEPTPDQIKVKPNSTPPDPPAGEDEHSSCSTQGDEPLTSSSSFSSSSSSSKTQPTDETPSPNENTARPNPLSQPVPRPRERERVAEGQVRVSGENLNVAERAGVRENDSDNSFASIQYEAAGTPPNPQPATCRAGASGRRQVRNPQFLSDYEKARLEGKTHLEALYAQFTPTPEEFARRKRANEELRNPPAAPSQLSTQTTLNYQQDYGPCPAPLPGVASGRAGWKVHTS